MPVETRTSNTATTKGIKESELQHLPFTLTSNSVLDELIESLKTARPNWHNINQQLKDLFRYQKALKDGNTLGESVEIMAMLTVLDKVKPLKGVYLSPIRSGESTRNFRFIQGKHDYIVQDIMTFNTVAEYDLLSWVSGLPVIWEIKSTKIQDCESLNLAMDGEKIRKKLEPLSEFYRQEDFGYVIAFPHEAFDPKNTLQSEFLRRGGKILPLQPTRREIDERINYARENHFFPEPLPSAV